MSRASLTLGEIRYTACSPRPLIGAESGWETAMPTTLAPDERVAFVFPGQGSQYVDMGKALYDDSAAAGQVFQQADSVLGFALTQLMFEGPDDELEDTINTQPAI